MKTKIPAHWPQQNVDYWQIPSTTKGARSRLDWMMPNGKKLRDCTFAEVSLIAQIFKEYAEAKETGSDRT